tara:strand:- start:3897 stop:4172 length:276 start_codon:yes stop_codon:yes gene_type:complete
MDKKQLEQLIKKMSKANVLKCKELLTLEGYPTDSLWNIQDVKESYDVTDQVAMQILEQVLNSEYVISEIFLMIDNEAGRMNLTKRYDADRD